MKKTIMTALALTSILVMTAAHANDEKVIFNSEGSGKSKVAGFTGCGEAKKNAISEGKEKCFQAGFTNCEVLNTKVTGSKASRAFFTVDVMLGGLPYLEFEYGYCSVSAVIKGSNNQ